MLAVLKLAELNQPLLGSLAQKPRELAEPHGFFVEPAVQFKHHLLEAVGPHDVPTANHLFDRPLHQRPGVLMAALFPGPGLPKTGKDRVGIVLVTILDEDVGRRLLDSHADHILTVLLQLEHERGKIAVAREQDEGADLWASKDEFDPIDRHADVGGILLRTPVGGGENKIHRGLGEGYDVLRVAAPVRVSPLHRHLASDHIRLEERLEFAGQVTAHPHGDVVKVNEEGSVRGTGRHSGGGGSLHMGSPDVGYVHGHMIQGC